MNRQLIAIAVALAIITIVGIFPTEVEGNESIGSAEDMINKYPNVSLDLIKFQSEIKRSIAESEKRIYSALHATYYDGVTYLFRIIIHNIHRHIMIELVDNGSITVKEYHWSLWDPRELLTIIPKKKSCSVYNVKFYRNCLAAYSLLTDHLSPLSSATKKILESLFKSPIYQILNEDDLNPWDIDQSSIDDADVKECSARRFRCIALLDYITKVGPVQVPEYDHVEAERSNKIRELIDALESSSSSNEKKKAPGTWW